MTDEIAHDIWTGRRVYLMQFERGVKKPEDRLERIAMPPRLERFLLSDPDKFDIRFPATSSPCPPDAAFAFLSSNNSAARAMILFFLSAIAMMPSRTSRWQKLRVTQQISRDTINLNAGHRPV
jgi:hypothetical protein